MFGRYALRSFGESTEDIGGGSGIAAMEYIEEDHVVILGYQAGYIEIWYRAETGLIVVNVADWLIWCGW